MSRNTGTTTDTLLDELRQLMLDTEPALESQTDGTDAPVLPEEHMLAQVLRLCVAHGIERLYLDQFTLDVLEGLEEIPRTPEEQAIEAAEVARYKAERHAKLTPEEQARNAILSEAFERVDRLGAVIGELPPGPSTPVKKTSH